MPTDEERREVARRLREGMDNRDDGFIDVIESAVFGDDLYHSSESTLERLADLIEPPMHCPYYHSDRHRCSAYDDVVDRDALLELVNRDAL